MMFYFKYLYFRLFKLYSKLEVANPYKYALNAFVIIWATNILYIVDYFFYKGDYPNLFSIVFAVLMALAVYIYLYSKKRYLKILQGIEGYKLKNVKYIFWIHIVLTIVSFIHISIKYLS